MNVRSFLGHTSYYRRFISNFCKIATPLFSLLHKDNEFEWKIDCEKALDKIKEKLMNVDLKFGSLKCLELVSLMCSLCSPCLKLSNAYFRS